MAVNMATRNQRLGERLVRASIKPHRPTIPVVMTATKNQLPCRVRIGGRWYRAAEQLPVGRGAGSFVTHAVVAPAEEHQVAEIAKVAPHPDHLQSAPLRIYGAARPEHQ